LDRKNFSEGVSQAFCQEIIVRFRLNFDQIGKTKDLVDPRKAAARPMFPILYVMSCQDFFSFLDKIESVSGLTAFSENSESQQFDDKSANFSKKASKKATKTIFPVACEACGTIFPPLLLANYL
jgi:hypothetical protein